MFYETKTSVVVLMAVVLRQVTGTSTKCLGVEVFEFCAFHGVLRYVGENDESEDNSRKLLVDDDVLL